MANKIFISAGEVSGDAHGAELISAMSNLGDFEFYGLGGAKMIAAGLKSISGDVSTLSTVGFVESLRFLFRKISLLNKSIRFMKDNNITTLIAVDNQGFSIPLLKAAKKQGIQTYFYIPPRVSIWGEWNAPKMPEVADYLIAYLESDYKIYSQFSQNVFYAGNPIIDKVSEYVLPDGIYEKYGLDKERFTVSIFPGSRHQEIKTLLDTMLKTADILAKKHGAQIILPLSHEKFRKQIINRIKRAKMTDKIVIIEEGGYCAMKIADVNIMASGTATLESALFGKPCIVCYRISPISFAIAKRLVKKEMIGLPNILLDKKVFPELLQKEYNPDRIVEEVVEFRTMDEEKREKYEIYYKKLKKMMGEPPVVKKVAQIVVKYLKNG